MKLDGESFISTSVAGKSYGTVPEIITEMNEIFKSISYDDFKKDDNFYKNFKTSIESKINSLVKIKTIPNSFIFYILFDWDNDINQNTPSIMTKLEYTYEREAVMIEFWKEYFNLIKKNAGTIPENMVFKSRSDDLNTTINNHNCQPWGSNQVHHEHSFWNMFSKTPTLLQTGYNKDEIEVLPPKEKIRIKKAIRDGLLDKVGDKYIPNNKCRNPNGSASAAWCYTTNPKVRWDYCMKPDISFKTRKIVLVILFILIVYLSYYMVKLIFQYNMFNKFVAMLTGGQMPGESGGGTSNPATV
jgi:hypothetical protein